MITLQDGKRVYTLKKVVNGEVTKSAHPGKDQSQPPFPLNRQLNFKSDSLQHSEINSLISGVHQSKVFVSLINGFTHSRDWIVALIHYIQSSY